MTPAPPKPLLHGPPSSSKDETERIDITSSNLQSDVSLSVNVTKTPRVAGAWVATPAPARSQTPQPTKSSSVPPSHRAHDRIRSLRLPSQRSNLRLLHPLSRAGTLPVRTPVPPGNWFLALGSLRQKSLLKVRFDSTTLDSAISDVDNGAKDGKSWIPAISRLGCRLVFKTRNRCFRFYIRALLQHAESSPAPRPPAQASRDGQEADGPTASSPTETTNYTTAASSPRRNSRRSPSVRLVDEYGRARRANR